MTRAVWLVALIACGKDSGKTEAPPQQPIAKPTVVVTPIVDAAPTAQEIEARRIYEQIKADERNDAGVIPPDAPPPTKAELAAQAAEKKQAEREAKQEEIQTALNGLFKQAGVGAIAAIDENDLIIAFADDCDRKVLVDFQKALAAFDLDPSKVFDNFMCEGGAVLRYRKR